MINLVIKRCFLRKTSIFYQSKRVLSHLVSSNQKRNVILGIETSCDDTGCSIVDTEGNILGEALNSQQEIHLSHGGILPPVAQELHRNHIEDVIDDALKKSGLTFNEIDAVATTVKPGLPLSLIIGMKYGKYLCKTYNKPFIPIHHMEAHALTIRLTNPEVKFPFLVLLISGGHCLLTLLNNVNEFLLLGKSLDDAPGEALDKAARRLKLHNLPEYRKVSGGRAIEMAAQKATSFDQFEFPALLTKYRDCNFSLAGVKNTMLRHIQREERIHETAPDEIIPSVNNLCASFLLAITRHLCQRTQRAIEFIEMKKLISPENKILVVSGGVACNNFIFKGLEIIAKEKGYQILRPSPKLCTDNGTMIAWNGIEKWKNKIDIIYNLDEVDIQGKCPLGQNIIQDVTDANIKCQWIKLSSLVKSN